MKNLKEEVAEEFKKRASDMSISIPVSNANLRPNGKHADHFMKSYSMMRQ